jgi:heme-degrading monooxygenase HmoA
MPALVTYTSGTWLVKAGQEQNFISTWASFAQWSSRSALGAGPAHHLQDTANPRSFLSFGPWESQEAIQLWRNAAEFQAFLASARELCEEIRPGTFSLVALAPLLPEPVNKLLITSLAGLLKIDGYPNILGDRTGCTPDLPCTHSLQISSCRPGSKVCEASV